jgi:hypothetical protein
MRDVRDTYLGDTYGRCSRPRAYDIPKEVDTTLLLDVEPVPRTRYLREAKRTLTLERT